MKIFFLKSLTLVFCLSMVFALTSFAETIDVPQKDVIGSEVVRDSRSENFIEITGIYYWKEESISQKYLEVTITGACSGWPTAYYDGKLLTRHPNKMLDYEDEYGNKIGTHYYYYLPYNYNSTGRHTAKTSARKYLGNATVGAVHSYTTYYTY